jgi:tripartite-type tricarboxylate transporter receptor subunit TctC
MKRIFSIFAAIMVAIVCGTSFAQQGFPSKPVHLLIPYAPGGAVDILGRTLGEELAKRWGQPVLVENRTGAGGVIASQVVAKAEPDGYTLIVVAMGHSINPFLYQDLPYDTFKDFTPISLLGSSPNVLLVAANSPYKSLADILAAAREKPGALAYGMAGNGTSTHLAGELLKSMAKVNIAPIAYKGGAPIIVDLLGGHIPLSFNNIPESISHINNGSLRALGVTSATRSEALPNVPTIAEAGVPGYDTSVWWGLLGPAGLPADLTAKISKDCVEAINTPAVKQRLNNLGATVIGSSPVVFANYIKSEYDKWGPIIKAAGIKIE